MSHSLRPQELYSPWNSPGQNTGVGSCSLRQGIFSTQGSDPGLPLCMRILYQLSYQVSPQFSSVQFSCSVMSDSLQPHESQHASPPCSSQLPEFTQTHVHPVGDAIQPSHPLSSPSPPSPNPSQHQGLFQ